jgi:hypothetical protein
MPLFDAPTLLESCWVDRCCRTTSFSASRDALGFAEFRGAPVLSRRTRLSDEHLC